MKRFLLRFNYLSFAAMLALIVAGTLAIRSAGAARAVTAFHDAWQSNVSAAVTGLVVYFVLAAFDYRRYVKWCCVPAYLFALVTLGAVLVFGTEQLGAKRWLWFFQPSELSKLCIVAFLAWLLGGRESPFAAMRERFRCFCILGALLALPLSLILLEPDLGTALTLVPAAVLMLFIGRVWRAGLVTLLSVGGIAALLVLGSVCVMEDPRTSGATRERIERLLPLRPHQLRRIRVFLYPERDERGEGYNLRQSKIAIGSGGYTGTGLGRGESSRLRYLPPSVSMNDFIFCVWAEETGFVGSIALLFCYGLLLLPCVYVAYRATDPTGRVFAVGWTMLVFAHVYVNIGMSVGLVPITGLPLPFISAGRTFLVTAMAGFGLIQSVSIHGRE